MKKKITQLPARIVAGIVILFLLIFPFLNNPFLIYLITIAMIFSIFAIAYDLLYGYMNQTSFGHSVFYGVPAYAVGVASVTVFNIGNPLILFGVAILSGVILGLVIGWICTFARGIYLALVTFSFAMIFFILVESDPGGITYGENGIIGVRPKSLHFGDITVDLFNGPGLYYLTFAILIISFLIIRALVNSQLGDILKGIKQNEQRLLSLGYNTKPYKILAFIISAVFSSLAGVLAVFVNNCIVPSMVEWSLGAEILLITILGGAGTLIGPVIGAFLVVFTEHFASSLIGGGNWVYILGGMYIAVVMFLPGGLLNTRIGKAFIKVDS